MKYVKLILIILLFISGSSIAQFRSGLEGFTLLDVKAGYSIPIGSFSETGGTDFETGYAQAGFNTTLGAYYFLHDWIGLGGSLGLNLNGYDEDARKRTIFNNNPEVNDAVINAGRYTNINFSGGVKLHKRFSEIFSVMIRGEAGLFWTIRPEMYAAASWDGNQDDITLERFSGTSFCLLGGISLQYNPSERVGVSLYTDITHGKPEFDYVTYIPPNWMQIQGTQDITLLAFGLQLTYIIGY